MRTAFGYVTFSFAFALWGFGTVLGFAEGCGQQSGTQGQERAAAPLASATIYVATNWVSGPWATRPNGTRVLRARVYCEPHDVLMTGGCELPDDGTNWQLVGTVGDPTWPITNDPTDGRSSWSCVVAAPTVGQPDQYVGVHAQCTSGN